MFNPRGLLRPLHTTNTTRKTKMTNSNYDPTQEYLDILLNNFNYSGDEINIDDWIDYLIKDEKELLIQSELKGD